MNIDNSYIEKYLKTCPCCGKEFFNYAGNDWAYKEFNENWDLRYTCSYSCLLKFREQVLPNRISRRKRVAKTKIGRV